MSSAQFNLNVFQKGDRNRIIFCKVHKLFTKSKQRKNKNTRNKLLPAILNKNTFIPKIFNNYLPLFLSLHKQSKTNKHGPKNYYLYIQKLKKLNFKNFFTFYLLNFLENFLKKKM
jgi:hypothetical protein